MKPHYYSSVLSTLTRGSVKPHQPKCVHSTPFNSRCANTPLVWEEFSVLSTLQFLQCEREAESPRFLNRLRITLTKLPLCKKYEHMHFLKEEKDRFKAAQDVSEIFDILDPYWNYFDYKLLEHLIAQFGNDTLKQTMREYVSDLEQFEKETSIQDYLDATSNSHEIPPELHTVIIEMDRKATECTLYDIRQFKESLANKSSLSAYTMYLKNLGTSSIIVTLAFPEDVLDVIIEELLEATFLDTHKILSVHIPDLMLGPASGLCALSDSDLSDPCSPSPAVSSINLMDDDMSPCSDEHPDQLSVNILVFPPDVLYAPSQLGISDLFSNDDVSENISYSRTSAASSLSVPLDSDVSVSIPPSPAISSINLRDDDVSPEVSDHHSYGGAAGQSPSRQSSKDECLKETDEIVEHVAHKEAGTVIPSLTTPHYPENYSESGYGTVSNLADTEIVSVGSHGPRVPRHSAVSHTSVTSDGGVVTETLC